MWQPCELLYTCYILTTVEGCRHERHAARRDQYRQRPAHWPLPRIEALVTGATCPLQLSVCLSRVPSQQTTQRVQKRLLLSTNKKCAEQLTDAIHCYIGFLSFRSVLVVITAMHACFHFFYVYYIFTITRCKSAKVSFMYCTSNFCIRNIDHSTLAQPESAKKFS